MLTTCAPNRRPASVSAPASSASADGDEAVANSQAGRRTVGLALGGGSARGFAHIGVLRWFEEHRIPIDYISGTSMGGLIAGAYAAGMSPQEIQDLMNEVDWDLMFIADSPYKYKTFRRKQDKRAYPSQLELGLKGGITLPGGLNPGQQIALLLDRIALSYADMAVVRRPADAVPLRGDRPEECRGRGPRSRLAGAGHARDDGDPGCVHAGELRELAAGRRRRPQQHPRRRDQEDGGEHGRSPSTSPPIRQPRRRPGRRWLRSSAARSTR